MQKTAKCRLLRQAGSKKLNGFFEFLFQKSLSEGFAKIDFLSLMIKNILFKQFFLLKITTNYKLEKITKNYLKFAKILVFFLIMCYYNKVISINPYVGNEIKLKGITDHG